MNKLLTISVAAYNIERYIDKLMSSIIQSGVMQYLEILIVNDGSKDKTAQMGYEYQRQFPDSVRVIDKPNGGHGSTINRGIIEATGKYFRALDGDDWVKSDNLARLVRKMETIEADMIVSDYCKCYADGREQVVHFSDKIKKNQLYSFDVVADSIKDMAYHEVIYRTSILKENDIRLDENCFYVDLEYMIFPIPFVHEVYYSESPIYCYRLGLNGQSVTAESRKKYINDSKAVGKRVFIFYKQNRDSLSEGKKMYLVIKLANYCKWHEKSLLLFPPNKENKKELMAFEDSIKDEYSEVYRRLMKTYIVTLLLRTSRYALYRFFAWAFATLEASRQKRTE